MGFNMAKTEYQRYASAPNAQEASTIAHEAHARVLRIFNSLTGDEKLPESVRKELEVARDKFSDKAQTRLDRTTIKYY